MLCNADYNNLHYGADGKYTSGNAKIDAYIENIISTATTSSMTQQQKLRAVYDYVFYHVSYRSNNNHVPRGQDCKLWTETYMLRLIDQGKGNCYCYASLMYYLARRIGYGQAIAVSGGTTPNNQDHGWLEITINGTAYLFDPELDYTRIGSPGTCYMKTYANAPWKYWRP